ncbi:hypothetical protein JY98_03695 [Exiguobacterium mexicanum]|nr:hypothetical protein JY98_03695 [Exiguobacterium mexicanum]
MDKRTKKRLLSMYSNGLNAHDITKQHNLDSRAEYAVTLLEVESVLKQQGIKDPSHRIPQKPDIQPDMPKRFIPLHESQKHRPKIVRRELTADEREWHTISCGFSTVGRLLLRNRNRHLLERQIVEHLECGFVQVGSISTDFYCDGEMFVAVVEKKEDHH